MESISYYGQYGGSDEEQENSNNSKPRVNMKHIVFVKSILQSCVSYAKNFVMGTRRLKKKLLIFSGQA